MLDSMSPWVNAEVRKAPSPKASSHAAMKAAVPVSLLRKPVSLKNPKAQAQPSVVGAR